MCAKLRTVAASNNRDPARTLTIACSRYIYNGVILHAHPVRGESHNQRNASGEVATTVNAKHQVDHISILPLWLSFFHLQTGLLSFTKLRALHWKQVEKKIYKTFRNQQKYT